MHEILRDRTQACTYVESLMCLRGIQGSVYTCRCCVAEHTRCIECSSASLDCCRPVASVVCLTDVHVQAQEQVHALLLTVHFTHVIDNAKVP